MMADLTTWNPMEDSPAERRQRPRNRLRWPIVLFREAPTPAAIESVTHDLSSDGFYCLVTIPVLEGEQWVCSIRMPTHDPQGRQPARALHCQAQVVRVVPQEANLVFGIACRILNYHLPPHLPGRP